ncbi:hypothetical protein KA005_16680 [bacterium]|nr:hypothetical protein [bacterium]
MRKYEYQKESRNFAQILGMTHAYRERQECGARFLKRPMLLLKYKISFYWMMLKLRRSLERGRQVEFHSYNDYLKLKAMWWSVFKRTYEPRW